MLTDLKEIEKFFKLCRKQGVTTVTFEGLKVRFGDLPVKASSETQSDEIETDGLSDEELAFYHVDKASML